MLDTKVNTIYGLAELISDNLERKERDNGETFVSFKEGFYETHRPIWEKLIEKQPYTVDLDFWYSVLEEVADTITLNGKEDMDAEAARELVYELEPDVYTSDLTAWLHQSNYHVEYLGEAVQEYGLTDGFQILSAAQKRAMEEYGSLIVDALEELAEEQ